MLNVEAMEKNTKKGRDAMLLMMLLVISLILCGVRRVLLDHDVPAKNINLVSLLMADSGRRTVARILEPPGPN